MKKKINKVLSLLMAVMLLVSSFPLSASAATNQTVVVDSSKNLNDIVINLSNGNKEDGWFGKYIKQTNRVAYCVQQGAPLNVGDNSGYTSNEVLNDFYRKASLADYFGRIKRTAGDSLRNELCTQLYIWELQGITVNSITSNYGGSPDMPLSYYTAWKAEVTPKIEAFFKTVSFAGNEITLKVGESITLTDTTGALQYYENTAFSNTTGATITKSGNSITITATSSSVSGNIQYWFDIDTSFRLPTLYYENSLTQDCITTGGGDPKFFNIKLNIEKEGTLSIEKVSDDNIVSGFEFNVKGEGVDRTIITDANGKFNLNLLAGTYVVTEINVPGRYETPKSQTVTVEAGKTATVTFNNKLETSSFKLIKITEGDGDVAGFTFTITGNGQTFNRTTDSNGEINIDGLVIYDSNNKEIEYTADETNVPLRYKKPASQTFTLKKGETTTITFENKLEKGELKLIKTSEGDGGVAGLTFEIVGNGQTFNRTTDSNGEINIDGLVVYDSNNNKIEYIANETNVPSKYVVPASQTFTLEPNKTTTITFNNILKKFRIEVKKEDSKTVTAQGDGSLAGAVYGVYKDGTLLDEYTTDTNGSFITKYYICTTGITVQEIKPSTGYKLDPTVYTVDGTNAGNFTVELNTLNKTVLEEVVEGKVAIIKHADNGATQIETPEVGAEFVIYLKSKGFEGSPASEKDTMIANENGYMESKNLPWGLYTVEQTKGLEGNELMSPFDVFINEDGKVYRYIINNAPYYSYVKITKLDAETGLPVLTPGAGYQLYDENNKLITMSFMYPEPTTIDIFYTNSEGYLILPEMLKHGNYKGIEVQAPYGYVLNSTPFTFKVTQDNETTDENGIKVIEVTQSNKRQKGRLTVTKIGEVFKSAVENDDGTYSLIWGNIALEDIEFDVCTLDGEKVDTILTKPDGTATTTLLDLGSYYIDEIRTTDQHVLLDEKIYFELTYQGQEIEFYDIFTTVENDLQKVNLKLEKVFATDDLFDIDGDYTQVQFGMYTAETLTAYDGSVVPADILLQTISLNENGLLDVIMNLPISKFYFAEISTDNQFKLSDEKYYFEFTVSDNTQAVVEININDGEPIVNDLQYGNIEGQKLDQNGNGLENALIGLFPAECEEFTEDTAIMTVTSDEDGYFAFENVPVGNWIVREITPPIGYELNETDYLAFITEDGETAEVVIYNELIRGSIEGLKISDDKKPLEGALIGLFPADTEKFVANNAIMTVISDENGKFKFKDVIFGEYIVREITPPSGHILSDESFAVNITAMNEIIEITIENKRIRGNIEGQKLDQDGVPLESALIGLFSADTKDFSKDTAIMTATSDKEGKFIFKDVLEGNWIVREITQPIGYELNDNNYWVKIETDNETVNVVVENKIITGSVKGLKVDPDGKPLSGAVIGLFSADEKDFAEKNALQVFVTGKDGKFHFENVVFGKHQVKEISSPDGYKLCPTVFSVNIQKQEQVIEIKIVNELEPEPTPTPTPKPSSTPKPTKPPAPKTSDEELPYNLLAMSIIGIVAVLGTGGVLGFKYRKKSKGVANDKTN